MAARKNMNVTSVSFKADEDLTSKQYYVLAAASTDDYVKICTGGCDPTPIGIQQDDVASSIGDAVEVVMFGPCYGQVAACDMTGEACPIGYGDFLTTASNGVLRRAGSGGNFNARAMASITTSCNSAVIPVFFYGFSACSLGAS